MRVCVDGSPAKKYWREKKRSFLRAKKFRHKFFFFFSVRNLRCKIFAVRKNLRKLFYFFFRKRKFSVKFFAGAGESSFGARCDGLTTTTTTRVFVRAPDTLCVLSVIAPPPPNPRPGVMITSNGNGSPPPQQLDKNLEGAQPTVTVLKSSSAPHLAITPDNKNWDGGRIPYWQPPGEPRGGCEGRARNWVAGDACFIVWVDTSLGFGWSRIQLRVFRSIAYLQFFIH